MRRKATSGTLTAQAIAGTRVVLLGMSVEAGAQSKLMGFAIKRLDHASGVEEYLPNFLLLRQNEKGAKSDHSSRSNPIQAFQWSDYGAQPGRTYTYTVTAMQGSAGRLRAGDSVTLEVSTEDNEKGKHAIYFNRGAAGWQAYEREFGRRDPDQVPERKAYAWLSRGLEEALIAFIGQAEGKGWGLRVAIYEFDYLPVLDALWSARKRGVDVQVVFDEKDPAKSPGAQNRAAILVADIEPSCRPRTKAEKLPHNKFIVLLKDKKPVEVWTGSTNMTKGGIFGHSNVGHVVRDKAVADAYLAYWKELRQDREPQPLQQWTLTQNGQPEQWFKAEDGTEDGFVEPPKSSVGVVFSPRKSIAALRWYAELMDRARESVFVTAPFGVSEELHTVFKGKKDYLRYLLLDHTDKRITPVARDIEGDVRNEVAVGAYLGGGPWHQWLEEHLTGFTTAVDFVHTKYMLIDPLGEDPIVITGSANFSKPSTTDNDENMLVIRGDKGVADVYLTEFMRLFAAFRLRRRVEAKEGEKAPAPKTVSSARGKIYLDPSPGWAEEYYAAGTPKEEERLLFSGVG